MLGELHRVADQVDEDLLEHPAVAAGRRQVADADRHSAVWLRPLELLTDGPGHRRHVDRHAFELLAAEPRQREQIVDQAPHLARVVADDPQQALTVGVESARVLLHEQSSEAMAALHCLPDEISSFLSNLTADYNVTELGKRTARTFCINVLAVPASRAKEVEV